MGESTRTAQIALFKGKQIRKTIHQNERWFSVVDVIEALTETDRPRKYWSDLKKKLTTEGYTEVSEKIGQLKMLSPDGKMRETDCANTETMFRIVQSIEIHRTENSEGVPKLRQDAKRGGGIAGIARKELEKELKRPVVSKKNYLPKKKIDKKIR